MSLSQNHKIHTTSLQVQFEGIEEGLGLQDRLALVFHEKVLPALEKEFDNQGDPDKTWVIPSLVLDCGVLTSENWEESFLEKVLEQFRKEMAAGPTAETKVVTKEKKASEVFFFFMQKGYFPWNSPFNSPHEVEKALDLDHSFLTKLNSASRKTSLVLDRIFQSFSKKFRVRILKKICEDSTSRILDFFESLQKQSSEAIQKHFLGLFLNSFIKTKKIDDQEFLTLLISNSSEIIYPLLGKYLIREIKSDLGFREMFLNLFQNSPNKEFKVKFKRLLQVLQRIEPGIIKDLKISKFEFSEKPENGNTVDSSLKEKDLSGSDSKTKESKKEISKSESNQDLDEEIFIENAGLVLLHPFIESLFSNLYLTENGKFQSFPDKSLATKILQFLVYGENQLTENHYVLNKILCGIDISGVIDLSVKLNPKTEKESLEMLGAVISHWSILKNTSVEGLRETFLRREGKITRLDKGWKVQVERKAVDVLLDKLPWGIGIIKLPWMSEMMYVDWN